MRQEILQLLRKKHHYYGHQSLGTVADYFGHTGPKVEVCVIVFFGLKFLGYRVSRERIIRE